jgi:lipoyl synthase
VCSSARCPNQPECFARRTATFLIMGQRCTRNCRFCAVESGEPLPLRSDEPTAVAQAAKQLGLRHVVITSVTRDDLADGGAGHFAATIHEVRRTLPKAVIEVLTPYFKGQAAAMDVVIAARPDIFNHNVETVPRLYPVVRPQADYRQSLDVLAYVASKAQGGKRIHTKSGMMVGLGETGDEVLGVMRDLRASGVEIVTIGQYLRPSTSHLSVERFVEPLEFEAWNEQGMAMGFKAVQAGPFVRSSYQAEQVFKSAE